MMRLRFAALAFGLLGGCTLAPHYQRPSLPVDTSWPADAAVPVAAAPVGAAPAVPAAEIGWSDFFADARLRGLVEIALRNNRDLRVAILNVAASQAQFRVQRADLLPHISLTGSGISEGLPSNGAVALGAGGVPAEGAPGSVYRYYTAGVGFTNFELDVFGRERSLTRQAFEQYLASDATRRSSQISLVGEVANDYFALLADQALLQLTRDTLDSQSQSYDIAKAMYDRQSATLLSLRQAQTAVDTARASLAQYQRQVAQDAHALTLVLGQNMPEDLPAGKGIDDQGLLADLPPGLPSDLLTRRPDIMSAEHTLRAGNANIGAARAAFFPSISLTASDGVASTRLSSLFDKGTSTWSFAPTITLPLFAGGQNRANLDLAHIEKDIGVAQYEKAIQTAFREVSDGLVARGTYRDQLQAQQALVDADADAYRLAQMRFRAGVDSYLATLDAQRSLYVAQQTLVSLKQAQLANLVTLYKALGGGWNRQTAQPPQPAQSSQPGQTVQPVQP